RVKPTLEEKGLRINDNQELEQEADVMGAKVHTIQRQNPQDAARTALSSNVHKLSPIIQQNGLTATHFSNPSSKMTIQKVKPAKPDGASRNARVFQFRGTWHCRDGRKHWVYNDNTNSW